MPDAETPVVDPVPAVEKRKRTWISFALAGAGAILLALAGYYLWPSSGAGAAKAREKNTLTRLTDEPFNDGSPTFTPDGQIRFLRFIDKRTFAAYIMNADGTGLREDTPFPGLTSGIYSPDGAKVFYHRAPGDPNFYLANVDGSNERVVPFHPGNCAWSPDSKQFLYQSKGIDTSVPNNSDIFIYTLEIGAITTVVESPFFESDPFFSP